MCFTVSLFTESTAEIHYYTMFLLCSTFRLFLAMQSFFRSKMDLSHAPLSVPRGLVASELIESTYFLKLIWTLWSESGTWVDKWEHMGCRFHLSEIPLTHGSPIEYSDSFLVKFSGLVVSPRNEGRLLRSLLCLCYARNFWRDKGNLKRLTYTSASQHSSYIFDYLPH